MGYSTYLKNRWLNCLRNNSGAIAQVYVSLHSGDPGDNGANEIAGGGPAYIRKAINWNAPAAGAMDDSTNGALLDVPPATTVSYIGVWDAEAAGNYLGSKDVVDEVFAGQGTYLVTDADLDLNA